MNEVASLSEEVRTLRKEVQELQCKVRFIRGFIRSFAPTPAEKLEDLREENEA